MKKVFVWLVGLCIFLALALAAPQLTINNPSSSIINTSSITFNITLNETGSAWFNLNNGTNISMNSTDNLTFTYLNNSLADGVYVAYFFGNDSANSTNNSESVSFTIDTKAPNVSFVNPIQNQTINTSNVTFNVTVFENISSIIGSINGTETFNLTETSNFSWTYTNGSIADGSYVVSYLLTDLAGNTNQTNNISFTINTTVLDTTPPGIVSTFPTNNSNLTTATVNFTLTINESATAWFTTNNGSNISMNTTDNLTFFFFNSSIADGNYATTFFANDSANNTVNTTIFFSINTTDVIAPNISITNPVNGSVVNTSSINFTVTLNESGSVIFNVSDSPTSFRTMNTTDNLSFYFFNSSIADGTYSVTFIADDASNNSANSSITFTVDTSVADTTAPQVTINSPSASTFNQSSITFNVTTNENSTVLFELAGTNYSMVTTDNRNFNYTNSSLLDGNYTVIFYVNDTSNNTNNSESVTFTVDTTAPQFSLTFPANNSIVGSSQNFSFSITDVTTTATSFIRNGSSTGLTNTWFTPFTSVASSGEYVISLTSTDAVNNTNTTDNFTYIVDVDTPNLAVNTINLTVPTNISINITESTSNISSVWYNFNGIENRTINASVNAPALNTTITDEIFPGSHTIIVYANDSVGNVVNQSLSFLVTGELNLSQQQDDIVSLVDNVSASFTLANGTQINTSSPLFNNSDLTNFTYEITINQSTPISINFTGLNGSLVRWNQSVDNITDNVSSITTTLAQNFSLTNFTLLSVTGQNRVFPNTSYEVISVLFDINPATLTVLYYFEDEITFDAKTDIALCGNGSYSVDDTLPCWVNSSDQTLIYLDSFSSIVIGNDTKAPSISVVQPTATLSVSEFTPTITVSADTDACTVFYNNTNSTTSGTFTGTSCTFPTISVLDGINGTLNFTVNDTSGNLNTTLASFNFSDTTNPSANITAPTNGSTLTSSSTTLSVTASETVSVTRSYNGGSFSSCFDNASSGSCTVAGLSDGSRNITINVTDLSGNSILETVFFTVDIDSAGSSSSSSSSNDDDDDDRPRRSSSSSFNFDDDDDDNSATTEDPFVFNDTPQEFQTTLDAQEEFSIKIADTIVVQTDDGPVTFEMVDFDDVRKTVILEVDGEQVQASMAGAITYDVDGDGEDDVLITVNNLAAGIAEIVVSRPLQEEIQEESEPTNDEIDTGISLPWLPISIVAGLVIIILVVILVLKHHERKHQQKQVETPKKSYPPYTPGSGPESQDFSANTYMKEEKSQTRSFSVNKFFKRK